MNTKSKGEITEAIILARILQQGWSASIPFGNNQRYDLIVDNGTQLLKSQCKTAREVDGCISFAVASKNGFTNVRTSYHGHIDIFLVYCPTLKTLYIVPIDDVEAKNEMRLRITALKSTAPTSTVKWAKDYLL